MDKFSKVFRLFCFSLLGIVYASDLYSQKSLLHYTDQSDLKLTTESFNKDDCVFTTSENKINPDANIVEFEPRPLFVYTHPKIRRWMTDKFLIVAKANVSRMNENNFLMLSIQINSENARGSYGDLELGPKIKVLFNNGEHIFLENIERDKGKVEKSESRTLYQGVCPLNKQNIKDLKKRDIYKLGIIWEEGYEEYEVHNIDLIRNQLNCLD